MQEESEKIGKYGLPTEVKFCARCTMNNQRPSSVVEFKNKPDAKKRAIEFDGEGVCEACRAVERKNSIDWKSREIELQEMCKRFRRDDGKFDCIVPGSGGKDSVMAAHVLKHRYGMHPLLVTWPPQLYTDIGRRNFDAWLRAGFPNFTYWPNQRVHALLTKLAFERLCHPFQPFIIGQKNLAPKLSILFQVPLVVYGENEAEYGNPIADNLKPTRDPSYYSSDLVLNEIYLGGTSAKELLDEYKLTLADLEAYLPADPYKLGELGTEVHYLGYYLKWHPQETYYYAMENSDFLPNDERTEGSYSKYSSIDDKIDWLHYYTTYTKFGIGRATYDSAQEIRNGDITREEGVTLVQRFDGEFPKQYLNDCLNYMGISNERFVDVIERARTPHLWEQVNGTSRLKKPIS